MIFICTDARQLLYEDLASARNHFQSAPSKAGKGWIKYYLSSDIGYLIDNKRNLPRNVAATPRGSR